MKYTFEPHYDFNYKGFSVRIFEIVRKFEGNSPKIVTLKLYIDGNFVDERTFNNTPDTYKRHYNSLKKVLIGHSLGKWRE